MPESTEIITEATYEWSLGASLTLEIGGVLVTFEVANALADATLYSGRFDFSGNPHLFSDFLKKWLPDDAPDFLTQIDIRKVEMEIGTKKGQSGLHSFLLLGEIQVGDQVLQVLFAQQKKEQAIGNKEKGQSEKTSLFSTRFPGVLRFNQLPFVGEYFSEEHGLQDLMLSYTSEAVEANVLAVFDPSKADQPPISFNGGLAISGAVHFPIIGTYPLTYGTASDEWQMPNISALKDISKDISSKVKPKKELAKNDASTSLSAQEQTQNAQKVGKKFGIFQLDNIEMVKRDNRIGLSLSGSVQISVFEMAVEGLEITVPMEVLLGKFEKLKEVEFGLSGLAIDIRKGNFKLAGGLLRTRHTESDGTSYDDYAGMVQLGFGKFQLTGVGSYAQYKGATSLFAFLYLGYPLGGTPEFFVTGLAIGFGINRNFIAPTIDKVLEFPLIVICSPKDAKGALDKGVMSVLKSLHDYLPPSIGDYFVVAGINFESFKIISTQALLAVKFGNSLEITLMGVSRLSMPAVYIELVFLARFVPDEGMFMAQGQLTSKSYLFDPSIQLTGGFAVGFWFSGEHAGDFIISIGGYHPDFKPPAHYPQHIPRVGLKWKLGNAMSILGEMYFALTPQAIMAGLKIEASLDLGFLSAFIRINANFIIYWKPFYYEARIVVAIGLRVTIKKCKVSVSFNFSLEAGLLLWGPDFSGEAYLETSVKTFKVEFGSNAPRRPMPIGWEAFRDAFIPHKGNESPCSMQVMQGAIASLSAQLQGENERQEVTIINPKEFAYSINCMIPATDTNIGGIEKKASEWQFQDTQNLVQANADLGIAPMDKHEFNAIHSVQILKNSGEIWTESTTKFKFSPILKNVPSALWGKGLPKNNASNSDPSLVRNVLMGFEITPAKDAKAGESKALDKETLSYHDYDNTLSNTTTKRIMKQAQNSNGDPLTMKTFLKENPPLKRTEETQHFFAAYFADDLAENRMSQDFITQDDLLRDVFKQKEKAFMLACEPMVMAI